MKRTGLVIFMMISLLLAPAASYAACKCVDKVTSDNYGVRAPSRLLHGVINLGLGWTKLITEPFNSVEHENQNFVDGLFDGFGQATYYSVLGAWDIATFWFPGSGGKDIAVKKCVLMKDMA